MKEIFLIQKKMTYVLCHIIYVFKTPTYGIQAPGDGSSPSPLFCGQFWPAWIRIHTNSFESGPETLKRSKRTSILAVKSTRVPTLRPEHLLVCRTGPSSRQLE
jgi:hypothetical protein